MDTQEKLRAIQKLTEDRLREKVLIPLLRSMGFKNVRNQHGNVEFGKDIVFCKDDEFGEREYACVQAKATEIHGSAGKSGNASEIVTQAQQAFTITFLDIYDGKDKHIDKFFVVCSHDIDSSAKESIKGTLALVNIYKTIHFIDGNKLVDLIDKHMKGYFWDQYDYFTRYFNAMKKDFETLKDVTAIGQKEPIPLDEIYVSLRVSETGKEREIPLDKEAKIFEEELAEHKKESAEKERERVLQKQRILDADTAVRQHNRLVIVGVPGSGKTTLLKHFALRTCKENLEKQERTCVPVPITLRRLLEDGKSLKDYIDVVFDKYDFPKAKDFVEKDLKDGKCRLLLDGFDELATAESQAKVSEEIHAFVEQYPKSQMIVTSRVAGYHDELKGFTKLELMEFDDAQIGRFIDNWFGRTDLDKAKRMFQAIKENERIKALARNPLMIAIIAIIYEEDRQLPQKRAALYQRCVEVLLSKWDVKKSLKNAYQADKKELILRKLAFYGHSNNKRVLSEKEIMQEMLKYFPHVQLREEDAKPFLEEIWQRSYLLRQLSLDSYDFLHLSFQEYFTALELKETPDCQSVIVKHLAEPWWEEPSLLCTGIGKDASPLIQRIKKEVPEDIFHSNLMLFGKCVADAEFTEPSLRDEIVSQLWDLYQKAGFYLTQDRAINVLALIKPKNLINSLIDRLASKEIPVRVSAAYALGSLGSEKAVQPLIKALTTDKESSIRWVAAYALGSLGSEKALEPLIKALTTDKESHVRWRAASALGSLGSEKAVEPLLKALTTDRESFVRGSAAYALGSLGSEKAVEPLLKALTTDKESYVRGSAASALGSLGSEKAVEPLLKALTTAKESDVRGRAASALGRLGSKKAVGPLMRYLTDKGTSIYTGGTVGDAAFAALEKICRRHRIRIPLKQAPPRKP